MMLLTKEQANRLASAIRSSGLAEGAPLARDLEALATGTDDVVIVEVRRPIRELTTAQVAEMFAVTDRTVRIWCETERIIAHRTPGGEWRIPADQFQASYEDVQRFKEIVRKLNTRFSGQPEPDDFE